MQNPTFQYKTLQQVLKEADETRRRSIQIEERLKRMITTTGLKKTDIVEYQKDGEDVKIRIPKLEAKDRTKTMILESRLKPVKSRPKTEGESKLPRSINSRNNVPAKATSVRTKKSADVYAPKKKSGTTLKGKKSSVGSKKKEIVVIKNVEDVSRPNTSENMLRESKEFIKAIGRRDGPGTDLSGYMARLSMTKK